MTYRINLTSFQNNLKGLSLNNDQIRYWVAYAWSQWAEPTGADFSFTYGGHSGATPTCRFTASTDGLNSVYVDPGCNADLGCNFYGRAALYADQSGNYIDEADVCLYNGVYAIQGGGSSNFPGGDWYVRGDNAATWDSSTSDLDLVAAMMHEFGHALGLGHTSTGAVMHPNLGIGTRGRHLVDDDIQGIRAVYGTKNRRRYWAKKETGGFSSGTSILSTNVQTNVHAAVAKHPSSGSRVVVTRRRAGADGVAYNRTNYPLTSSSSWSTLNVFSYESWRAPAIAGRPETDSSVVWLAGFPTKRDRDDCGTGLRMHRSTDGFESASGYSLTGACTLTDPAITWDPDSERWVLMWVQHVTSNADYKNNNRILAATSTTGASGSWPWVAQSLGIWTIDGVSASCSSADGCMMTYARSGSDDPWVLTRKFTVDQNGQIQLGSVTQDSTNRVARTPAALIQEWDSFGIAWVGINKWTGSSHHANGRGDASVAGDWTFPLGTFDWETVDTTFHTPALAGKLNGGDTYAIYVK